MPSVEEKVEEQYKSLLNNFGVRHYGKTEKSMIPFMMLWIMQIQNLVMSEKTFLISRCCLRISMQGEFRLWWKLKGSASRLLNNRACWKVCEVSSSTRKGVLTRLSAAAPATVGMPAALRPWYQYPTRLCPSRYRVQATDVSPEKEALTWSTKYPELCRGAMTPVREDRTFAYLTQ